MKLMMNGWLIGEAIGRWPNLILTREEAFPNHDRRRDYSSPNEYKMKIEISSLSGNFDIESFLDLIYEVEKFF